MALGITGQGWAQAERAAARFLEVTQCAGVLIIGFAGATRPDVGVGEVVIPDAVVDLHEGPWSSHALRLCPTIPADVLRARLGGHGGALGTVGRVVSAPSEKQRVGQEAQVVAIDMESASAATVMQLRGMPWGVMRVILDPMTRPLGITSAWQAIWLAVTVVGWGRLWQFRRDVMVAQRRLGDGVSQACETVHQQLVKG